MTQSENNQGFPPAEGSGSPGGADGGGGSSGPSQPVYPQPASSGPPSGPVVFPIMDMIKDSWRIFSENIGILLGGMIVLYVILIGANYLTLGIAGIVLGGPLMLGYYSCVLKIIRREPVEFGNLFDGFKQFLPAFLAALIMSVFIGIGTLLCILPGLFLTICYMLTYFYLYDKNLDFWPAMEASRTTAMANLGQFILLFLAIIVLNLIGALACGVGLLITAPMSAIVLGLAYERVEGGMMTA